MRAARSFGLCLLTMIPAVVTCGCASTPPRGDKIVPPDLPGELNKVTLPEYVIEPPDVLLITAIQAVPRQPYKLQAFDTLSITVLKSTGESVISGLYTIDPEGMVFLGLDFRTVRVADLTSEEAQQAIEKHFTSKEIGFVKPAVSVSIAQIRAAQQVAGEHLVRSDGTVYLGRYGSVFVTGLTLSQARKKIEEQLDVFLNKPEITIDVLAYNSKVLYVIFDGAGVGQQVYRLPITGNDTVLDAISQVNGLGPVADKRHIWVARPAPRNCGADQVLPVDWDGITTKGQTATNYQLMPGDRLYVKAYTLTTLDTAMARAFAPIERALGITLLGTSTAKQIRFFNQNNGVSGP